MHYWQASSAQRPDFQSRSLFHLVHDTVDRRHCCNSAVVCFMVEMRSAVAESSIDVVHVPSLVYIAAERFGMFDFFLK